MLPVELRLQSKENSPFRRVAIGNRLSDQSADPDRPGGGVQTRIQLEPRGHGARL